MAILISNPAVPDFAEHIAASIREGAIPSWLVAADGYFTLSPSKYRSRALFYQIWKGDALFFALMKPKNAIITPPIYGIYHGRFVEMLLANFPRQFTSIEISASPMGMDIVN